MDVKFYAVDFDTSSDLSGDDYLHEYNIVPPHSSPMHGEFENGAKCKISYHVQPFIFYEDAKHFIRILC